MKNLSTLEKAVYERELKSLQAEIGRGIEIIRTALAKYSNCQIYEPYGGPPTPAISAENSDAEAFNQWVNNLPIARLSYLSDTAITATDPDINKAPEFLRKAILAVAIREFIAQVDSVEEVRNIAEQANHAANQ